ncbi:MAG: class I SAM-dependent methyltransferase [Alphaproteobacteria bacterium]
MSQTYEAHVFFKQWIKKPFQMGTFAPISKRLAKTAANAITNKNGVVVEIGAGTGRLTKALLDIGVSPSNLFVNEIDPELCEFLKKALLEMPQCQGETPTVIEGDARDLEALLPDAVKGSVDAVVSAIPLMYMQKEMRKDIIDAAFGVLKPGGEMIHITYSPISPINFLSENIEQKRIHSLIFNFPPGFVWKFTANSL